MSEIGPLGHSDRPWSDTSGRGNGLWPADVLEARAHYQEPDRTDDTRARLQGARARPDDRELI